MKMSPGGDGESFCNVNISMLYLQSNKLLIPDGAKKKKPNPLQLLILARLHLSW